jgi:hypothetical protein
MQVALRPVTRPPCIPLLDEGDPASGRLRVARLYGPMSLLGGESWPVHEPLVPMRYGSSTGYVSSPVCGAYSCLKIDSRGDPRVAVRSRPRGATRHRPASPSLGLGMLDPLPPGPGRMAPVSNSRRLALMTRPYPRVGRPGSWPRWTSRSTKGSSERPSPSPGPRPARPARVACA